jgi:hypothetical protein
MAVGVWVDLGGGALARFGMCCCRNDGRGLAIKMDVERRRHAGQQQRARRAERGRRRCDKMGGEIFACVGEIVIINDLRDQAKLHGLVGGDTLIGQDHRLGAAQADKAAGTNSCRHRGSGRCRYKRRASSAVKPPSAGMGVLLP